MPSQSEDAYQKLRKLILGAGVLPGDHLAEVESAARFGVGRFAIREALRRLHGEGLVTRNRGKYYVTVMTTESIREISQLRAIFEAGSLRLMKGRFPAGILKEIRKAAADYALLVKKGYLAGAGEADLRFHNAIVASSRNCRLIHLYESSNLPLLQIKVGSGAGILDDYELAAAEHASIVLELERGAIGEAAQLLEDHLKRGEREVLRK